MAHEQTDHSSQRHVTHLPLLVASPGDINRLSRELERIDEALMASGIRGGEVASKLPRTSKLMDEIVGLNHLNLLREGDRRMLKQFLEAVTRRAPVLHMSFSADPSTTFLEKLVAWLRREIHPQVLLTVGLQPSIGAGCVVRTPNHQFDFSLRQDFTRKRQLLLDALTPKAQGVDDEQR